MAEPTRDPLNTWLWAAQCAVAATFHLLGLVKALVPPADVQGALHLVAAAPPGVLQPVGAVELLGSLGVILPAATGVLPALTPLAAACLAGVALLGAAMPDTAGAFGLAAPNVPLAAACAWIAWGRVARAPVVPLGLREAGRNDRHEVEAYFSRLERDLITPKPSRTSPSRRAL